MHLSQRPQRLLAAALALSFLSPIGAAASPINSAAASDSSGVWRQYLQAISRLPEAQYRGAKPHHKWRRTRHGKALVSYPTQIEHVVVIVMENRTVDNLFDGFYNTAYPTGGTFGDASHLNLCNPNSPTQCAGHGPLTQYNLLCAPNCAFHDTSKIDPIHSHANSFWFEAQNWSLGDNVYRAGNRRRHRRCRTGDADGLSQCEDSPACDLSARPARRSRTGQDC